MMNERNIAMEEQKQHDNSRMSTTSIPLEVGLDATNSARTSEFEDVSLSSQEDLDQFIQNKVLKDNSPEAKAGRRRRVYRAVYGEFMCSLFFYTPIFAVVVNASKQEWPAANTSLAVALVVGLQGVALCYAFSNISGAHFNSAISFALFLTGKLSTRRTMLYILAQFLASLIAMTIVTAMFTGDLTKAYDDTTVYPVDPDDPGRVFATEFFLTFFLTYMAFTVAFEDAELTKKDSMSLKAVSDAKGLMLYATSPQSKTGFAPFVIGFTIFSLALLQGSSGGAFNPGRLFGPAVFSGKWDFVWLYFIAEFAGGAVAGLMVHNLHRLGLTVPSSTELPATKEMMHSKGLPLLPKFMHKSKGIKNPISSSEV